MSTANVETKKVVYEPGIESIGQAVCAIGAFDGVHKGHQFIIGSMIDDAHERGVASVIVTFDIDPDELFLPPERVRKLLSNEDRMERLCALGADYLYVLPFTFDFAALSSEEFLDGCLGAFMDLQRIHVGFDFRFGAKNSGTVETIQEWGERHGCVCHGYDLLIEEGDPVTATRIRNLLAEGDAATATKLLGYAPYVTGTVVHGRGEGGKDFDIPTANVVYDTPYCAIADGVYAGYVRFDGVDHPAAINMGIPPTFADRAVCRLEPHILDFDGDIYGREVSVAFVERLRDEMVFKDTDELKRVIGADIARCRELLM